MREMQPAAKRGIGFAYHQHVTARLLDVPGLIDFCELSPDVLCREQRASGRRVLAYEPTLLGEALSVLSRRPLVVHGLGLSIGTAGSWNESYLARLDELRAQRSFDWHSEHLAFLLTELPGGAPAHVGIPLPLPFTDAALELLVPRVDALHARYGVPFLLENLTYYLPDMPGDHQRDEVDFLNDLTERTGARLLLDLYNFWCNATNFGFDPFAALSRLRLDRVVEIHLAGGTDHAGFEMDVHSRIVPDSVWELLDWIAPAVPNLSGIVYEVLEEAVPHVGTANIAAQLVRARAAWDRHLTRHGRPTRPPVRSAPSVPEPEPSRLDPAARRSLASFQVALGELVVRAGSPAMAGPSREALLNEHAVSDLERVWLEELAGSPGLAVTAYIARWWRETKIEKMAKLTLSGLHAVSRADVLADYLDREPVRSLFFLPEVFGFLSFVASATSVPPAVRAIARFEHALLRAHECRRSDGIGAEGWPEIIRFPAPIEQVLGAVLDARAPDACTDAPSYVLVDPALEPLWAPCVPDEESHKSSAPAPVHERTS